MEKYTVLLMLPDYVRDQQCCAADWVTRVYVEVESIAYAEEEAVRIHCSEVEGIEDPDDLGTVAIYAGHIFDQHLA